MTSIIKDIILPLLPSALTMMGWWIVASRDGNSKKNLIHNKRVESASKLMDKILLDAKKFYSLSGSDIEAQTMSHLIASDFKKLSTMVTLISKELREKERLSLAIEFIEYKKTITGGQFGTISRISIASSNQLYIDIDTAYDSLYMELEKSYLI